MIHPATKTGTCRSFGPANGTANLNSMPMCHAENNMIVQPDSPSQVCTKIYRPSILYTANSSDTFLSDYNRYAYVTCNVRKMVVCKPSKYADTLPTPTNPASYAAGLTTLQQTKCKTERQVTCANVCRISKDGQLCKRGDKKCLSKSTWTPTEARVMMQSDLLGKSFDLGDYDCDPSRCKPHFCYRFALD